MRRPVEVADLLEAPAARNFARPPLQAEPLGVAVPRGLRQAAEMPGLQPGNSLEVVGHWAMTSY